MTQQQGRRVAEPTQTSRSWRPLILAVAVPLVTLAAIAGTSGEPAPAPKPIPPEDVALASLQVVCPPALTGELSDGDLSISSAKASGEVLLRLGDDRSNATVAENLTTLVPGKPDAVVVDGREAVAPGLLAARIEAPSAAATSCAAPQPDYWFTGVGSASIHSSELELVNPDAGAAVAEIEIYGANGPLAVNDVRGVTVPGGTATTIDLAQSAPNRHELSVHVRVARGRLGVSMVDRIDDVDRYADWLPAQAAASTTNVLLGLTKGSGTRSLVLSNPTEDQARIQVKVIGSGSTYAPVGIEEVSVPPESVVVVDVSTPIGKVLAKEESGILLTSNVPVTAGLRSITGSGPTRDLSHAPSVDPVYESAVLIPEGKASLVLAAPTTSGAVTVTSYDAEGERLASRRVAVKRLTSATADLPAKASLVVVRADDAPLPGAIRVLTDRGTVVLPLQELVLTALVPAVTPGSVQSSP